MGQGSWSATGLFLLGAFCVEMEVGMTSGKTVQEKRQWPFPSGRGRWKGTCSSWNSPEAFG